VNERSLVLIFCGNVSDVAAELEDEDDLIVIAEEADLNQKERFIEDGGGPRGGRDGKRSGDIEEAVRAAEEMMLAINLNADEVQPEQSEGGHWQVK